MILILGGTKSGKSSFASLRATEREHLGPVVYLATAEAGDDEIRDRIRRHRAERPDHWLTVEESMDPAGYFVSLGTGDGNGTPAIDRDIQPATVILDCITMWLTNLLMPMGDEPDREQALEQGRAEARRLAEAVAGWEKNGGDTGSLPESPRQRETIIVSNQVETGLVSPWPLGRIFQDLAGLVHQAIAAAADEVYLMNAGLPLRLK